LTIGTFLDILIRFSTILIKGAFVFVLAKNLNAFDFGLYVAVTANIAIFQYLIAGDFSYIAHRELLANRIAVNQMLGSQLALFGALFIIASLPMMVLLPKEMSGTSILLTFVLVLLEALTSELQRHLAVLARFTHANFLLFLKSAGWMIVLIFFWIHHAVPQTFLVVIIAWAIGLSVTLLIGLLNLISYCSGPFEIDAKLIRNYCRLVPIILIGTLAARALFSIDRLIVEHFFGLEDVGIYGLFAGIATAFVAILDAGLLVRAYPDLVRYSMANDYNYWRLSRRVQIEVGLLTLVAVFGYQLLVPYALTLVGKSSYIQHSNLGLILIVAYGIYSMSFPLNCKLYANGKDRRITIINIFSLLPFLITPFFIYFGNVAVAVILCICALLHYFLRILSL
jgi:O-antigen/teichoic acid export membrane protein